MRGLLAVHVIACFFQGKAVEEGMGGALNSDTDVSLSQ
jgi:hypothetical protein